jgi:MFS family permease
VGIAFAPGVAIGVAIAADWRVAYVAFAVLAGGVALLVWRISPGSEEVAWAVSDRQEAQRAKAQVQRWTTPPSGGGWFTMPLLILYVAAVGTGFIYRGSLTFLAVHFERELGIDLFGWEKDAIAGATASLALLMAVLGLVSGGWLSDRIPGERAILPYALVTPLFLVAMWGFDGVVLLVAAAGFAVCSWAQQPIMNSLITDYAPAGAVGRSFGVWFTLVFGVGSLASTFTGLISERWDTGATFLAMAMCGVVVAGLLLVLERGAELRRDRTVRALGELYE